MRRLRVNCTGPEDEEDDGCLAGPVYQAERGPLRTWLDHGLDLIVALATLSLLFTVIFALKGHWILALLV